MAATKKKPKTKTDLGVVAIQLAVKALKNPAVQEQLSRAPAAVVEWATERREQMRSGQLGAAMSRLNPADRFGQRGLERRIEHVSQGITLAFGERSGTSRVELWNALDELERAIAVAGGLPMLKRKQMHMRIDNELDELETGLIDALLPKS